MTAARPEADLWQEFVAAESAMDTETEGDDPRAIRFLAAQDAIRAARSTELPVLVAQVRWLTWLMETSEPSDADRAVLCHVADALAAQVMVGRGRDVLRLVDQISVISSDIE